MLTIDASVHGSSGNLVRFIPPVLFLSLPIWVCAFSSWPGPPLALALAVVAVLPRLLWQPSQPAEGARFLVASALYQNFVYPCFFGSPILLAVACWLRPLVWLPLTAYHRHSVAAASSEVRVCHHRPVAGRHCGSSLRASFHGLTYAAGCPGRTLPSTTGASLRCGASCG